MRTASPIAAMIHGCALKGGPNTDAIIVRTHPLRPDIAKLPELLRQGSRARGKPSVQTWLNYGRRLCISLSGALS
jgi:hypothetical protein